MNLQTVISPKDFAMLRSHADNPLQKGKVNCQGEQSEQRETTKWVEYNEFVNCFTSV